MELVSSSAAAGAGAGAAAAAAAAAGGEELATRQCINLGSYNYLGFADDWPATCRDPVLATAARYPTSLCTSSAEGGFTSLHRDLEECVAQYVGKEAACVFNMGWATNALGLPALFAGKGTLIVSDSLNHNSIVAGARTSGATVRIFRHNDVVSLRNLLRAAIREGQERTHRPWRRILVCVEGIYSMEGEFCRLAEVVRTAKEHKAYVYLDEAHSVGATGATGRGVCEHAGVDPADVDVLMGTFTKSFGAMGGYIAGSAPLVAWVKRRSAGFLTDNAMSPAVAQQVLSALRVMRGVDGTDIGARKLATLRDNANYFRTRLINMGCEVLGEPDSPVIPMLIYSPTKVAAFSRECLARGVRRILAFSLSLFKRARARKTRTLLSSLTPRPRSPRPTQLAVVVVGFPATPLLTARARFCVSAGHTRADLDRALGIIESVADLIKCRYQWYVLG
jgi:serine palmitoyltransferase